tara:strand:+ start:851 stop:1015 length:165 start_codon:yes stop_codon:yes gene_type:complete
MEVVFKAVIAVCSFEIVRRVSIHLIMEVVFKVNIVSSTLAPKTSFNPSDYGSGI